VLPLYTFLVSFLRKEGRERKGERESKNKQTYLVFFKERREKERERVRINRLALCVF